MTKVSMRSFLVPSTALILAAGVAASTPALAAAATAAPYPCVPNGPAGSQMVYGTFGDASVIGWALHHRRIMGVIAALSFVGAIALQVVFGGTEFVPKSDSVIDAGDHVLLILDPGLESQITGQFTLGGASVSTNA